MPLAAKWLAVQIAKDAELLGAHTGFKVQAVYGGVDYKKQRENLAQDVDILVGTPGRLIDYWKQRVYDLESIEILVIDDGSTDPIEPVVNEYGHGYMRIEGPNGPGVARNHAARYQVPSPVDHAMSGEARQTPMVAATARAMPRRPAPVSTGGPGDSPSPVS